MVDFSKILVAVDFSDSSRKALETAHDLAQRFGGTLHLLHCYPAQIASLAPYAPVLPLELVDRVRKAAAGRLGEWRDEVCSEEVNVLQHLSPLPPAQAIEELAEELGVGLVVIGTRGLTGLKHVLLGSVAERVVRGAPCPVFTVKG